MIQGVKTGDFSTAADVLVFSNAVNLQNVDMNAPVFETVSVFIMQNGGESLEADSIQEVEVWERNGWTLKGKAKVKRELE